MLLAGFLLYCANYSAGLFARDGRFRNLVVHRILYALNIAAAGAVAIFSFQPVFVLPLAALALMPFSKPWGRIHPILATLGLAGYLYCLINSLVIRIL